ncbi:MAG: carboxypeptidase regulatory-like domain-containing protein, partial [Streptomyces sp.]|nr:carboxypeptidase regulatory-like domain-containing protein [Streptomyces sp.]
GGRYLGDDLVRRHRARPDRRRTARPACQLGVRLLHQRPHRRDRPGLRSRGTATVQERGGGEREVRRGRRRSARARPARRRLRRRQGRDVGLDFGRHARRDRRRPDRPGPLRLVRDPRRAPSAAHAAVPQPGPDHRYGRHRAELLRPARRDLLRDAVPAECPRLHTRGVRCAHPAAQPRLHGGLAARREAHREVRPAPDHAARDGAPGRRRVHDARVERRLLVRRHVAAVRRARSRRRHRDGRVLRRDRRQLGTSVLVSLISSRVGSTLTDSLTDAGVPHSAAARFEEAKDAVAMGVAPVSDAMPAQLRAAVVEGSHTAFMNGVHTAVLVTGVLALVGAALAAFGLRGRKDGTQEDTGHTEHGAKVPSPAVVPAAAAVRSSAGVPVSGHVVGAESAPVPRAVITLISLGGRQVGRMVAHSDGAYAVDAPGVGSYVLITSAEGYQPQASTVVVGGEPVSYDILLSGTSGLVGTVRSADLGKPVAGATVVAADVRGDVLATELTDTDGTFGFAELVPGPLTLAVTAAGYRPIALPVEIAAQGVTRTELELSPGLHVRGMVQAAGRPLNDARVTLVDTAGNVVATATTGEDGGYAFTDLDGGQYTVTAAGYPPKATQVTVHGSGVESHDIELSHPDD